MPEIVPVVSEALEAQVRDLLPSQRGFGEDLQASNVITPIIDLTATAQGTQTPQYLQTALAYGSSTPFNVAGSTSTIANTPGFYQVTFAASNDAGGSVAAALTFSISDGLSTKIVYDFTQGAATGFNPVAASGQITVFLRSGDSLIAGSDSSNSYLAGSIRQVADVNGNLVNPVGFTPQ